MASAIVVFAEGFEEIEALSPVDVLRRAGVQVRMAGLAALEVASSRGVVVRMDCLLSDACNLADAIVLPGGMPGSKHLGESALVAERVRAHHAAGKVVAAICAAPAMALSRFGVLDGRRATCYPGCEQSFTPAVRHVPERVVTDGTIITGQGPGSALEFSLVLAKQLAGADKARSIAEGMLLAPGLHACLA